MVTEHSPDPLQLRAFVEFPREDLGVEYKSCLDLTTRLKEGQLCAKAATPALANHGGGVHSYSSFSERDGTLESGIGPSATRTASTKLSSNMRTQIFIVSFIGLYTQTFGTSHVVIRVPGNVPVMSKWTNKVQDFLNEESISASPALWRRAKYTRGMACSAGPLRSCKA